MRQVVIFAFMALGYLALGFEVREIQVTGQDNAQVIFVGQVPSAPQNLRVNENSLEFAFPATYLSDRKSEKLEILSPHALIKRVTLVQGSENALKGKNCTQWEHGRDQRKTPLGYFFTKSHSSNRLPRKERSSTQTSSRRANASLGFSSREGYRTSPFP